MNKTKLYIHFTLNYLYLAELFRLAETINEKAINGK